jgi:hypothetical protein
VLLLLMVVVVLVGSFLYSIVAAIGSAVLLLLILPRGRLRWQLHVLIHIPIFIHNSCLLWCRESTDVCGFWSTCACS